MSYTLWDGHPHPAPHYKPPMGPVSQGYSHVVYRLTNYTDTPASLTSPVLDAIKTDDVSASAIAQSRSSPPVGLRTLQLPQPPTVGTTPGAPTFNVLDFGATADGSTDSTAAINRAVTAASRRAHEPCSPAYLCGISIPTLWFPAGEYIISGPITGVSCAVRGDGHAIIRQMNSSSDIFVAEGLWRWQLSGLTLDGGANQVHIGNENINTGFYQITDMVFSNATNTSIRITPRTASTQATISRCIFVATQRVVVNHCDKMVFSDNWVEVGCPGAGDSGGPLCVRGRAVFENYCGLTIERMVGVPIPGVAEAGLPGYDLRWVDHHNGYFKAVDSR